MFSSCLVQVTAVTILLVVAVSMLVDADGKDQLDKYELSKSWEPLMSARVRRSSYQDFEDDENEDDQRRTHQRGSSGGSYGSSGSYGGYNAGAYMVGRGVGSLGAWRSSRSQSRGGRGR